MWRFSADGRGGGSWSLVQDFPNSEAFKSLLSAESAAYANTDDKGFSIGGWVSPGSQQGIEQVQIVPGMVSFDMRTKEISNGTTNDAGPTKSPIETLIGGQAHFLPSDTGTRSETGLILLLGGHKSFVDRQIAQEDSPGFDLSNLTFFDPDSRERYWQIATRDIPPYPRVDFCVTGFAAQGGGYDMSVPTMHQELITQSLTFLQIYIWRTERGAWLLRRRLHSQPSRLRVDSSSDPSRRDTGPPVSFFNNLYSNGISLIIVPL